MPNMQVGNISLAYEEIGQGPPLLLIMGIGANLALWDDDWCAGLAARGFRVIRFDNRDCGQSSQLTHLGVPRGLGGMLARSVFGMSASPPYTIADMASDAAGLLRGLGIARAHVVGLSMGGMIAQQLAIAEPAMVLSLTSIMSTTGSRWHPPTPGALRALLRRPDGTDTDAYARSIEGLFAAIGAPTRDPVDVEGLQRLARKAALRGVQPEGFVRQLAAVLAEKNRAGALAQLRLPALVVHGKQDPLIPVSAGRATAKAIAGSTFLPLDNMGHDLPRRHWPTIFDAIVAVTARASA